MKSKISALLAGAILAWAPSQSGAEAKHTGIALSPTSFASFDREYLGGGGHFIPNRLSPKDLEGELERFKVRLQADIENCGFFSCIAMDLIEAMLPDGMSRQDVLDRLNASELSRFTQGAWGIVAANADNDPDGADNLFVIVDDRAHMIHSLDFLHPEALDINSSAREVLELLDIEVDGIRLPTVHTGAVPLGPQALSNPRGIVTNRRGDFWVADMGKNRIVRYRYDPAARKLVFQGALEGLNHPMDLALLPAFDGMGEMLAIANTGGNSIRFAEPYFLGVTDVKALPAHASAEISVLNGAHLANPTALASDPGHPERLFLAHGSRRIARVTRTGAFDFQFVEDAEWPFDGEISSLKCDPDGDLLVVDRIFSFLGKYTPQLDLVFTTGGLSDGSDPINRNLKTGFSYPKYIAVGNSDDIFVSERWQGFTGVQRFNNWPRFMDRSATLRLDCDVSAPPAGRTLTFGYALTKKDDVAVKLYQVPEDGSPNHVLVWQGNHAGSAGPNTFTVPTAALTTAFDTEGTYRVEFEAQASAHPGAAKDLIAYALDFSPPDFMIGTTALGNQFFNPDLFGATVGFNISREADIVFKAASKDISGIPTAAQFVTLGTYAGLQRLEQGSHILPLNIAPAELAKVTEMQPLSLWAELSTVPCGTKRLVQVPIPGQNYLHLDRTAPGGSFQAFAAGGFNPRSPDHAIMTFSFDPSDNSANLVESAVAVYRASDLVNPVRRGLFGQKVMSGGSFQGSWDGVGEDGLPSPSGQYVFSALLQDLAGNKSRINSPLFRLDLDAPAVTLSLPGSGLEFTPFQGQQALLLKSLSVDLGLAVQEALPKDVVFRLEKINPADGGVTGVFAYTTVSYNAGAWPPSIRLDPLTFPGDGIYALSVYGTDQVGNTSAESPVRTMASPQIGAVKYIWVDHFPPLVNVKLIRNVIRSGGRTDLVVTAYHQGVPKPFDFSYAVELFHGTTKLADFASGTLTPASNTAVLPFNHAAYLSRKGKFTFKVRVTANIGRVGNGLEQSADLYVDVFPPQISGLDGMTVPRKFFLTGQVGDPNLVNDLNANGFEEYRILWKAGPVTSLPADLSGWSSAGVSVPIHAIDRSGPNAATFPFSPVGDNQEAITSAFGSATLAYLDGTPTGANFATGSTYTVLLAVKEKGKPLEVSGTTSALRTFQVGNSSSLAIGGVTVNGTTSGPLDFDAATGTLNVSGSLAGGDPINALLRLYVYPKQADIDGDGLAQPIAVRLEKGDARPGQPFSFQWDGKDGKGSFVKDGEYSLALVLEQAPAGRGEGPFDLQVLSSRDIRVKTPLRLVEGILSPTIISSAPASSGLPGNTASFRYKATKPSYAYLEIQDQGGNRLFDVGPEANQDGAGVFHVLGWNATHPATGLPVAEGTYRVRPYAVQRIGDAGKSYYDVPDTQADHYLVTVTAPQQETPTLGSFALQAVHYGNSDAIWSSRPGGQLWKVAPATLTGSIPIKIRGTQTVQRYLPAQFYGDYFRRHTQAMYRVKSRIGILRNKRHEGSNCDDNEPCTNRVNNQDWVYLTTSSNLLTEAITWRTPRDLAYSRGQIYFDSPEWEGILPGSRCVTGASDDFFCEEFNMELVRNSRVLWSAIYSMNDELLDIIYQDATETPGQDLPTGLFSVRGIPATTWSIPTIDVPTYIATRTEYRLDDPDLASNSGNLPAPFLIPGVVRSISIPRMDPSGGVRRVVNADMYAVDVSVGLPPGGMAVFTKPYPQTVVNSSLVASRFMVSFSGNLNLLDPADRMEMPIEYSISLSAAPGLPTTAVPGVPFPFPPSSGCGLNTFRDALGQDGVDIWANTQGWERDHAGNPIAQHPVPANGCDYFVGLPTSLTLQPGGEAVLPLAGLVPAGVADASFLFADNGTETQLNVGGALISARIEQGNVVLRYPVNASQATRVTWNPAANPADDDPVLTAHGHAISGYMQVGGDAEVFGTPELLITPTFTQPDFVPVGREQNLFHAYEATANALSHPLPGLAQTAGEAWKTNQPAWKRAMWMGASGTPEFHWDLANPRGLDFQSWEDVAFKYIDNTVSGDYQVFSDSRDAGSFTPEVAPLATPRRLVPIEFNFPNAPPGLTITGLMALKIGAASAWEPIPLRPNLPADLQGRQLLAYWEVTNRAGSHFVRLLARDGAGNPYQVTTTLGIGVELEDNPTGPQEVFSPLRQASLIFPPNSSYRGLVAVDPTDPRRLPGFAFGNIPKGMVVDVTPSGLIFDEPNPLDRPQLVFNLRVKDIEAMGGHPDRLGEIGIYYLNEKTHALEKAPFAATYYHLADPSQRTPLPENHVLQPSQVLVLTGALDHTSLYGTFSLSSFVTIDPVASPTTSPAVALSGTGSTEQPPVSVHLYVSSSQAWTPAATFVGTATVDSDGKWSRNAFPLPFEGRNYVFAAIGPASVGNEPTNSIVIIKDGTKPTVAGIFLDPAIAPAGVQSVQAKVVLSEPGDVSVYVAQVFGGAYVAPTREEDGAAVVSIPLTNLNGGALDEGEYTVFVTGTDRVGNQADATHTAVLAVDRTAPSMTVDPIAFAGRLTGGIQDNYKLGQVRVFDQAGSLVRTEMLSGKSALWRILLDPSDFPGLAGKIRVVGYDMAGNPSRETLIGLDKLFPDGSSGNFVVSMRDERHSAQDGSLPSLAVRNNSNQPLSGFTVRLWLSREELPHREVIADPHPTNPCGIRFTVREHPDNGNLVMVDAQYPLGYALAPGQSTPPQGLSFGLHFKNSGPTAWSKVNDWSWTGISPIEAPAPNVTLYGPDGVLLAGVEPSAHALPQPPPAPAPDSRSRVTEGLQALWLFHEGRGPVAADISGIGIPMNMVSAGAGAEWRLAGGLTFTSADHNSILQNRTPNGKLSAGPTSSEEISLEAWLRPGNLTQDNARILGQVSADGAFERNWEAMQMGRNLMFRLRTSASSTVELMSANHPLASADQTYHVVMTYSAYNPSTGAGGMRIYVNGNLVASNQERGTLNASGTNAWDAGYIVIMGNRPSVLDRDWQGTLSLAAVYSKALSSVMILKNRDAGMLEPALPAAPLAGLACGDRLVPADIVDGPRPWLEDRSANGSALSMGGTVYAKGLGGKAGASGSTSFLVYDLDTEGVRLGLSGRPRRITGFTGLQAGGMNSNTLIRISRSVRKPSDQDWINGTGSVTGLFTSNNGTNIPVDLDIAGARWLFLGQSSALSGSSSFGDFAEFRVHFGAGPDGGSQDYLSGLMYRYYEGTWDWLPEFASINPLQAGIIAGFDLSPRLRSDRFAFEFEGYLRIVTPGTYTFYTNSDDGSKLSVDGRLLVDNNGVHPRQERSGSAYLDPGLHPIRVVYFDKDGDHVLEVEYQGPGVPRSAIPASSLFRPAAGTAGAGIRIEAGLQAFYDFRKKPGPSAYDLAAPGLPLDLDLIGGNAAWIEGGGISLLGGNHNTILENRTPNAKLANAITQTGEMTFEAWIETANLSQSGSRLIFDYGHPAGNGERNFALAQEGRNLQFKLRNLSHPHNVLSTNSQPLASGTSRYHVALTYEPYNPSTHAGGMRIFVNGVQAASNSLSGALKASGTNAWSTSFMPTLGNIASRLDRDWEGKCYLVAIYDRALSPAQVLANFQAGIPASRFGQAYPLGVTTLERPVPMDIQDGRLEWAEDRSASGASLLMGGVTYRTGLGGAPQGSGALSWMLYDLERERFEMEIPDPARRLTGFAGRQSGAGDARLFIKTSASTEMPSLSDWVGSYGGVVQRLNVADATNVPFNLDLKGSRWLWLAQSTATPADQGEGVFGQVKLHFASEPAPIYEGKLAYRYFEGNWSVLPDFDALTPLKAGLDGDLNLSQKTRSDNFAFEYRGFIKITAAGSYTFFTSSDDGSRLFIDGVKVVDNDGIHAMQERSGTMALEAGFHAIKIQYFDGAGGEGLEVRYQGPGIAKTRIPSEAFYHSESFAYGVEAKYFEGSWNSLPDFPGLVPASTGVRNNFLINPRGRADNFGFSFEGQVFVPTAGDYTFYVASDDGSRLSIDGSVVVENDGLHGLQERSGTLALASGYHRIQVAYFDKTGSEGLAVQFKGPGIAKTPLPSELLFLESAWSGSQPPTGKEGAILMGGEVMDRNFTISGTQWFKIPLSQYANSWARKVVVALDHMDGRVMQGGFRFENGAGQNLYTWFQSFQTAYQGQGETYFVLEVPEPRTYKVRWWFE